MKRDVVKVVRPKVTVNHELENNGFRIEIDLSGADKESVELEIGTYGISVKAENNRVRYECDYSLGYSIIPEKTEAKYGDGVLCVSLPIKEKTLKGRKIEIVTT
jgi:HSP20 family molecular chaperone IbpA